MAVPTRPSQTDPHRAERWQDYRTAIGAKIRALRIERGLSQEALALSSGVTRNVLIDVERGKRGLLYERIFDIAVALGVPGSDIIQAGDRYAK